MSPETRWLLDCLRTFDGAEPPSPALSWERLLATAESEGLAAGLAWALRASAPPAVPLTVQERLNGHLVEATARHLRLRRELGRVLRGFAQRAIPVITLKGLALAETLYPDPIVRPSSDLDLLVRPAAVLVVDGLLGDLGYRRLADAHSWSFDVAYDRATLYAGPDGVHVDLHWALLSDPRYAWNEREGLAVWERAVRIHVAGESALGLGPEDLLLYLATHVAVHHGLTGLLWYWDLARFLDRWSERLDWTAVLERAGRWRVRRALGFALSECQRWFGVAPPAPVRAALRSEGARARLLARLLRDRQGDGRARLEHLIAVLLVDRGRDLWRALRDVLGPAPGWVRARYDGAGASLGWGYVAHYLRLAGAVGRLAGGLGPRWRLRE